MFFQSYRLADRWSNVSTACVSVVELLKSSSPLHRETAAALASETLLTTDWGPQRTSVVGCTRTGWITGCLSGSLIMPRSWLYDRICLHDVLNVMNGWCKIILRLTELDGQIPLLLEWWAEQMNSYTSLLFRATPTGQMFPDCAHSLIYSLNSTHILN